MAHGTTKVDKTTLSQQDEVLAVGEGVPVHLGLDVRLLLAVLLQPLDLDLAVEVTNVADDCVVLHHHEVLAGQDVLATSGGDKDVASGKKVVWNARTNANFQNKKNVNSRTYLSTQSSTVVTS